MNELFDVLYTDPPWRFGSGGARGGEYAELDYPTMSVAELKELPVQNWLKPNCAMFMWVTGSFLTEALEIGAAWGFKFIRVDKVWVKKTGKGGRHAVVGPWGMTDAEFMLLFVRGQMCSKQRQRNQFVVEVATYPGVHSRKPQIFRQMIEDRFPAEFKRLELFSREKVPGWTVIGNDIDGRDIREVLASLPANDNQPMADASCA